jgi:hypothetical protein
MGVSVGGARVGGTNVGVAVSVAVGVDVRDGVRGANVGVAVSVAVGADVGDRVGVESSHHGVGGGERDIVGAGAAVLATQNSNTSGSSLGLTTISRPVGSVSVSSSNVQVAAPSMTARRVVSPLTSILICEGMLGSDTEQAGVEISYECSCAVNRRVPSRSVTCR